MVCSARLRISSRDKEGPSDFLAFSNFNYKKFKKFVHFLDLGSSYLVQGALHSLCHESFCPEWISQSQCFHTLMCRNVGEYNKQRVVLQDKNNKREGHNGVGWREGKLHKKE